MRVFFSKNRYQHIGASDFFFAVSRRLHMHDGALNHTLKAKRWLGVNFVRTGDLRRVVFDEVGKRFAQVVNIGRTSAKNFCGAGVVQQGQQQMLYGDEFMPLLPGLYKGHV